MIQRMPDLRDLQLAPLTNENRFEELCLSLWKRILNQPATQLNGRRGQRQCGVDIFGRRDQSASWVAIQCKVRTGGELSEKDINDDVESAKAFNPSLSEMIFATTARRDQGIQEFARTLTDKNLADGYFSVTVWSWDDITEEISQEQNLDLCRRFFEGAMINYENLGIAVSRIVRVSVGVAGRLDSTYELLLGRTPKAHSKIRDIDRVFGLNHWRGNQFIGSWNDKTLDTFPDPTFASDLEQVFRSKRDAYIVSKWLNQSAKNFTDILYGETDEFSCEISEAEFREFADSLKEPENE
jgi:hypothetical protein